ncbi:cation diffusion facilitator family transporter [Lutispora thermophila]|uniref:Cation diffusion facilitator family transporter n=1 Tax=Lutispora thermophila DSM 19022 TaxID=1122184 RepID=A0A1M6E3K3_9FIRM|nr:cation diffusion facilitator family transporter [Lutispora thermophila]SHI79969.1 cation diffusion facilitator family transporter [Lutispora thermophila DSM 19022]
MFTDFLIKTFVRDYKNTATREVRQRYAYLSGITGIISNIILFLLKLSIGLYLNSIAVMADAFNNLSDVGSSVVTIFGFMMSGKPADKEHPFGHGRFEYIAAMVVSLMVIVVGFEFVQSSIKKIVNPEALRFSIFTFILLLASIIVKVWLALFNRKIGRTIGSKVMEATAFDSLSDVAATSVVALSLMASKWITIPIDGYVGLAVSIFILYNGYNLIKDTLNPLLGEAPDEGLVKAIMDKTLSYEGVIGIHDLIVHNYGPGRIVASIHAEMPYSMDIMEAHDIIDRAEKEISEELGLHLVIHMDPINTDDKLVQTAKTQVMDVLKEFPQDLSIHDFRVVGNEKHLNVIFDMVVPYEFREKDEKQLVEEVKEAIKKRHPNYDAIITIDRQYSLLK